jgi:hypothetical protein
MEKARHPGTSAASRIEVRWIRSGGRDDEELLGDAHGGWRNGIWMPVFVARFLLGRLVYRPIAADLVLMGVVWRGKGRRAAHDPGARDDVAGLQAVDAQVRVLPAA